MVIKKEGEWDLFFKDGAYRLYPIRHNGAYEDGYLPLQEDHIASVYYGNAYLKSLEALARERGDV